VAKVASEKNIVYTQSCWSSTPMKDIPQGLNWFQLFIFKNKEMTKQLIKTAELNNFKAIVITVSSPVLGKNISIEKARFTIPKTMSIESLQYVDKAAMRGGLTMKFF
jgi:(S)-2-hydroxy-acid oxidase